MKTLNDLVQEVDRYFALNGVQVPYFIAGGSVFSILNGSNHYSDIDVFFYNEIDFQLAANSTINQITYETENAISFNPKYAPNIKLQFIKLHTGHVTDVMKTFDLNCSKCAYTSDRKLILSPDYSKEIKVDTATMNGLTLSRYFKYTRDKKATDPNNETLHTILRHLVDNFKIKFGMSYEGVDPLYGIKVIELFMPSFKSLEPIQYIHDYVMSKDEKFRMNFFGNANKLFDYRVKDACDEYKLFEILRLMKSDLLYKKTDRFYDDEDKRIKLKYAEFFI